LLIFYFNRLDRNNCINGDFQIQLEFFWRTERYLAIPRFREQIQIPRLRESIGITARRPVPIVEWNLSGSRMNEIVLTRFVSFVRILHACTLTLAWATGRDLKRICLIGYKSAFHDLDFSSIYTAFPFSV